MIAQDPLNVSPKNKNEYNPNFQTRSRLSKTISHLFVFLVFVCQAADRGPLQRRRPASGRDGERLSDRLWSEHVTAGAPHDLQ